MQDNEHFRPGLLSEDRNCYEGSIRTPQTLYYVGGPLGSEVDQGRTLLAKFRRSRLPHDRVSACGRYLEGPLGWFQNLELDLANSWAL